jgi:hypothetical protein
VQSALPEIATAAVGTPRRAVPHDRWHTDIVEAYANLLFRTDRGVRSWAAFEWCLWESAHARKAALDRPRRAFPRPDVRARVRQDRDGQRQHDARIEDGAVVQKADRIGEIPGVVVNGRFDSLSPLGSAWALHRAWPRAELVVVEDADHDSSASGIRDASSGRQTRSRRVDRQVHPTRVPMYGRMTGLGVKNRPTAVQTMCRTAMSFCLRVLPSLHQDVRA